MPDGAGRRLAGEAGTKGGIMRIGSGRVRDSMRRTSAPSAPQSCVASAP
jgi:hypothetical protein